MKTKPPIYLSKRHGKATHRDGAPQPPARDGMEPRVEALEQEVRRLQQIVAEQKLRIDALAQ